MTQYTIADAAIDDLDQIEGYIAADNPAAADRVVDALFEAFLALTLTPGMGHKRPDLTNLPVRFWTVRGRHTIVYRERDGEIEIVRVFGAGRDVSVLLGG